MIYFIILTQLNTKTRPLKQFKSAFHIKYEKYQFKIYSILKISYYSFLESNNVL